MTQKNKNGLMNHPCLKKKLSGLCLLMLLPFPALAANTNAGYTLPFNSLQGSDTPAGIFFTDQYENTAFSDCRPGNICTLSMTSGSPPDFGSDLNVKIRVDPHDASVKSTTVTLSPNDRTTCEKMGGKLGLSLEYHSSDPFHYSMRALKFCLIDFFSSEGLPRVEPQQAK